ncbi:thioesterase domain-containing protein [Actinoplanes sp. NPDC026619]|uniref:thioesterase domain-containing protein n=1 Tax=Actinoplanes sp. NPDC026619 TaxID=3155798 RepID=UPI00340DA4EC
MSDSATAAPGRANPLVTVQPGTGESALYCFHPLSGSAAVYGPLVARIGRDQQAYGLQAVGLLDGWSPDPTVTAMARRYATAIQPHATAPAVFLGYSLGGVLAVETAGLLADRLRVPPRVVLIDCDPLYLPRDDSGPWQVLVRQTLGIDLPVAGLAALPVADALAEVRAAGARQGRIPARMSLDRLAVMLRVCEANETAAARHVTLPYPGTVHVVRSAGAEPGGDSWHAFADRAVVTVVPVGHHDIMGAAGVPVVADVVRALLPVIRRARGR